MANEEATGCKNKEKCCSCFPLDTGIKLIGGWLCIEFVFSIYSIFGRAPPQYLLDILTVLMTGCLFACFILVMVKKDS